MPSKFYFDLRRDGSMLVTFAVERPSDAPR
jgi:hypothetical protein